VRCVLVSGATGFVGSAIVRQLVRRGDEVHAIVRPTADRSSCSSDVHWHVGDLVDGASLQGALQAFRDRATAVGASTAVVHAAAVISYRTGDRELQESVNVEGTRLLLDASRQAGIGRFVHVSSVVTVGFARTRRDVLDESSEFNGAALGNDYIDTKRAAEELALASNGALEVVVVNPGAVFGPGADGASRMPNTAQFVATVAATPVIGLVAPPGGLSVVGVEDVAHGIVLALDRGRPGRRYLLTESNRPLVDLYRDVFALSGRGRTLGVAPGPVWSFVCAAAAAVDRVHRLEFATPQALRLLRAHFRCSSARARSELGWSPRPFGEVLVATLDWLRDAGLHD
jgi:dihydroflavonol-4-reductase